MDKKRESNAHHSDKSLARKLDDVDNDELRHQFEDITNVLMPNGHYIGGSGFDPQLGKDRK